ncbi:MAG: type I restriction endonuclease subunit R [Candidatus Marinimicrobia bacterium]|nr:type I restriction endonuclease subunit R [Candidatus Neomarinimicrobiota bacterium]
MPITEAHIEETALKWFESLGYQTVHGPDIAPGEPDEERETYGAVILVARLRAALERINPAVPADALEDALRKVFEAEVGPLEVRNRTFHKLLVDGVPVEYQRDGRTVGDSVMLVDFDRPANNDWLVANQFTVIENGANRRPDMVVFVNGLPLAVLELKNPADETATLDRAWNQLQTYKRDIPSLFTANQLLVISDGVFAKAGTLTGSREWFIPWRTVDGVEVAPKGMLELKVLIDGIFQHHRFLDIIRHFIVFEDDGQDIAKKVASYHQYHAVNKAVASTITASAADGDQRVGVIWHTQGSGKSLSMAFYSGKVIVQPEMANPTLILLTDRNDLDDQLFGTFSRCKGLLRQDPIQATSRDNLKELLDRETGGVIFTTIQKFAPDEGDREHRLLSDRRNIIFIADEAHRSQYDFIDGYATFMRQALPNASFIGFTGTPIDFKDRSTQGVFGDYIDVYDIQRAVDDGATVPIYYTARLAKITMEAGKEPEIDADFDRVTEREESATKERLKSKWARLEAMVGTPERIAEVAEDIVTHFEGRLDALDGKGMIVAMSRRIAVSLYDAIVAQRPNWHNDDDEKGFLKVVMTGSASDPPDWQLHIRTKAEREAIARRFKDAADPFKLVIVRDMWLTGFDVPPLHTMYIDKPMQGHGLMQAIARVNRVFGQDKKGGLVVDYLGIADKLKRALEAYTDDDRSHTGIDQEVAVEALQKSHEIAKAFFHGFDYLKYISLPPGEQLEGIRPTMEFVLEQDDGKKRFLKIAQELYQAFALAAPHPKALALRAEVAFFRTVRASLVKSDAAGEAASDFDLDLAVGQIVAGAVYSEGVIDIFTAAGLDRPNIAILSDEFLEEVRGAKYKNLAIEALKKILNDEIKVMSRRQLVQSRSFADMLLNTLKAYQNRTIEAAQVIAELIDLAKGMREAHKRGEQVGLTDDELAFYDALEVNDSAVKILGDDVLRAIARDLVEAVRNNVSIDWTLKESARAKMRTAVRRLLKKHGYPPDKQESATKTVIEQAEMLSDVWAVEAA